MTIFTAFLPISKPSMRACILLSAALVINCAMAELSAGQIVALQQPQFTLLDPNGVDLLSANVYLHETDVSIGSKDDPLAHTIYSGPDGAWTLPYPELTLGFALFGNAYAPMDSFSPGRIQFPNGESPAVCGPASAGPTVVTVQLGNSSEVFLGSPECQTFSAAEPTGDTLKLNSWPNGAFTYTKRDGTQVSFLGWSSAVFPPDYSVQEIIYPSGRVLQYWYGNDGTSAPYLKSITRSDGLQLKYTYGQMSNGEWELTGVTAINNAYEYCSPTADTCALKMTWPTASYSYSGGTGTGGLVMTVTRAAGGVARYTMDGYGRTVGVKLPSSAAADNFTYNYCDGGCTEYSALPAAVARPQNYVQTVKRDGQFWTYSGNPGPIGKNKCTTSTYGFANPVGSGESVSQQLCEDASGLGIDDQLPPGNDPFIQKTDEQGNVFYGPGAQINEEAEPEGNTIGYSWTGPNLIAVTHFPKAGSPLTAVTSSANYVWAGCNALDCNEPNFVIDDKGNRSDYTYNPANGEVATATLPPDGKGVRPQTNYTYVQRSAYVQNAAGPVSSAPIWVLDTESYCRTSAATTAATGQVSCAGGAADEVVRSYQYGPVSGPNNLFLRGVAVTSAGVTHLTCYGYDRLGNRISTTTPNAVLASCP